MKLFKIYRENRKIIFIIFGIRIRIRNPFICYHTSICSIANLARHTRNNVKFVHPFGIVVYKNTEIGKDCNIFQRVTIAPKNLADKDGKAPKIGKGVTIYSDAIILGDITIGDGTIIAAKSVVTEDIPPRAIVMGNPAKVCRYIN